MNENGLLRIGDLVVLGIGFLVFIGIGVVQARKNVSGDAFFMAGRRMPGWAVGFSIMATVISSLTFIGLPAYAYTSDWKWLGQCLAYPVVLIFMLKWFMPFFRKGHVNSAYEYLENRFGICSRFYVASGFIISQLFRTAIILYATSISIGVMLGFSVPSIILVLGIVVIIYTVAGGLEAVIWTDVIQGTGLILGGAICLPIICHHLPGGFGQIVSEGLAADKISLGPMGAKLSELTFLLIFLSAVSLLTQLGCVDQIFVQRYCAAKSYKEARKSIILGVFASVPIWFYFTLLGTALWVFYKAFPVEQLNNMKPEEILPFFILSRLPAGVAGFVYMALIMAAMSTIDSGINASAATVIADFYQRFFSKDRQARHYVFVGRVICIVFGVIMIGLALVIHCCRVTTIVEAQQVFNIVCGSGLLGLFLLGFATKTANNKGAIAGIVLTIFGVIIWLVLDRKIEMPHKLWIGVFANIFVFVTGYLISLLFKRREQKNLSVQGQQESSIE